MSLNISILNNKSKRVAIIASNPTVSQTTGWNIGYWMSELTHPLWEFMEKGYEVDVYSPEGGDLVADTWSDPEDESKYSEDDLISLGFKNSPKFSEMVKNTPSIDQIDIDKYDAVFLVGGQSPMYTFIDNTKLHELVAKFYESGKIVSIVCHATCVLLKTKTSDGKLLVDGKTWTGFANSEEAYADAFVGQKIQPFWIEDEAKKLENTNFIVNARFSDFAVRDGNLITGQQQYSGAAAARLVIQALGQ